MESRPMLGRDAAPVPKRKAGAKPKAKRKPNPVSDPPVPEEIPVPEEPDQEKTRKGRADPEIETLELKRKAVLLKNKWIGKLEELNTLCSDALARAKSFTDCTEFLDKLSS